MMNDIVFV